MLRLLGSPQHDLGDTATPLPHEAPLWLLTYLACHDERVPRDELLEVLFPDTEPGAARNRLRNLLHRLRGQPWGGGLDAGADSLRWTSAVDVRDFRRAVAAGDWAGALAAYHGPLLEGTRPLRTPDFEAWLEREREHLQGVWQDAVMAQAAALEQAGRAREALPWLERVLAADPLLEVAVRASLRCAAQAGLFEQGQRHFERFAALLRQELGLEPEAATLRLHAALREQPGELAAASRTPLGAATPFFGREAELSGLLAQLDQPEQRLLTLSGPGGVGKTRLARRTLEAAGAAFTGARFVVLDAAQSADALVSAIGAALGQSFSGSTPPLEQLLAALSAGRPLLVLDNLEQLLVPALRAGVLDVLLALLEGAPGLTLLVTSRRRLGLQAEWVMTLGGLEFPGHADLSAAARSSAVRLFVERAGRVQPGFALSTQNVGALVEICQLCEGLPLALELSAAWAGALAVQDIARELRASLDLAEGEAPDRPERHHSLRAAFGWSWTLLTPVEQRALARLSVFRGGFELGAGVQVGGAPLRTVLGLADHSLLRRDREGRYGLHEVVRQYAAQRLEADPDEQAGARAAHAAHYLAWAEQAAPQLRGPEQARWLERLATEHDNLHTALDWLLAGADAAPTLRLATALHWYWYVRGHHREGRAWLAQALARAGAVPAPIRAGALYGAGWLARELGEYADAQQQLEEARQLAAAAGDGALEGAVLHAQGLNLREQGQLEAAQDHLARAEGLQRGAGDRWGLASTLNDLGITWLLRGDLERARGHFEESLQLKEAIGDRQGVAYALANLGNAAEDPAEYLRYTERSLVIKRELGDRQGVANSLFNLAELKLSGGDQEAARALLTEALELFWQLGRQRAIASTLSLFARLALADGQPELCLRLAGAALALTEARGFQLQGVDLPVFQAALADARQRLPSAAADDAERQGRCLPLASTVELLLVGPRADVIHPSRGPSSGRDQP